MKTLIIFLLFSCFTPLLPKILATFPELKQPNRIYLDSKNIYITERTTIHVYSLEKFTKIKTFGKHGEGPGEFMPTLRIHPAKDHILINSLGKVSFYTKAGELIKEVVIKTGDSRFEALSNGYAGYSGVTDNGRRYATVNLFDKEFRKGKELYRVISSQQGEGRKIRLFQRAFMFRVYKDRIFIAGKEGFILDILDNQGKLLHTIQRKKFKRHKIDSTDIKNARKYFRLRYGDQYEAIKNRLEFPKYFPEIRAFYPVDNKVYILPYEWKEDALKFYIYTIDGKFLAAKFLPFTIMYSMQPFPFAIQNDHLSELCKIKGFWIRLEMELDKPGLKSTLKDVLEVTEISEKKPPENTFTLPKNYKQTDPIF